MSRLLITHSLLNAWEYMFKDNDESTEERESGKEADNKKSAYECFLDVLNRNPIQPTVAMIDGRNFESLVSDLVNLPMTGIDESSKWYAGASKIADIVQGGIEQVRLSKSKRINGVDYLLYGVLDWLKAGVIYDVKHKQSLYNYDIGDYYNNTQHRMYFELEDGADRFVYLISNGREVYREEYSRKDINFIDSTIVEFEQWLKLYCLWDTYTEKWQTRR